MFYTIFRDENIKTIGIYSIFKLAKNAKNRVSDKPGFIDFPEGFSISEEVLDRDGWVEGFIT